MPYAIRADRTPPTHELLAAPIINLPRYANQPIYFSDVIVRQDSHFHTFADLQNSRWTYNDPHSLSGHFFMQHHLQSNGFDWSYFGDIKQSGGHHLSIQRVLAGQADCASIASDVLDLEKRNRPELNELLRTVHVLGAYPEPPFVVGVEMPAFLRQELRHHLLTMHHTPAGQAALNLGLVSHFAPVKDDFYNPIREQFSWD